MMLIQQGLRHTLKSTKSLTVLIAVAPTTCTVNKAVYLFALGSFQLYCGDVVQNTTH